MDWIIKENNVLRVIGSTRPPKEEVYECPKGITQENVSTVDIINGAPVISETRKTAYKADKAAAKASMASIETAKTARMQKLATSFTKFNSLSVQDKDTLLKDILEELINV